MNTIKIYIENLNWLAILFSLIISIGTIILFFKWLILKLKQYSTLDVKNFKDNEIILTIGLGVNDPYKLVLTSLGLEVNKNIKKYHRTSRKNPEGYLTQGELDTVFQELEKLIANIRKQGFKVIHIFYAGPVVGSFHIGYALRNFAGKLNFYQFDQKSKKYKLADQI
jgi:hypothetical protein